MAKVQKRTYSQYFSFFYLTLRADFIRYKFGELVQFILLLKFLKIARLTW